MEEYLIVNANVLTFGFKNRYIADAAIHIGRGVILDFGTRKEMEIKHPTLEKLDMGGKVVMPGFVDLHNHLYSGFFQNMPIELGSVKNYNEFMNKFWWKLTDKLSSDGIFYSAVKGIIKAIKSGTTTIFNLHSSPNCIDDSLNDVADAFLDTGMRGVIAYEISNRKGEKDAEKMFEVNANFVTQNASNSLINGMIGLYNVNEVSDALLTKISNFGKKTGCGLMLHLSETGTEDDYSIAKFKKYTIDRLNDHGLLNAKTLLVGANNLDEYEADVLVRTEANVVLTPSSSLYKSFEFPPIDLYVDKNIPLSFGTDGIFHSISGEADFANRLFKQHLNTFDRGNKEVSNILMNTNYKIANKFVSRVIGEIKPGAAADLIAVDYHPEIEINDENLYTHLMFGILQSRIDTTIVDGKVLMKDYKLVELDIDDILEHCKTFANDFNR
ncbi:MAG: amidohydrolase family protein [Candidatus Delongbacteria bacterium]|nr:amidohydrolase family protein [Candidatus Delongbacteria bacterium]MBN2835835.1 amidohydrolase family protein [Candidatus Delongbacteria bacterium]